MDLSTSRMKCIGASWLIRLYEHLAENPQYMINGFCAAGITQSIDAGEPVPNNDGNGDNTDDDDSDITTDEDVDDSSDDDDGNTDSDTDSEGIDLEYDTDEAMLLYS